MLRTVFNVRKEPITVNGEVLGPGEVRDFFVKDDPLRVGPHRAGEVVGGRTIWLDRENMLQARDNYWNSFARTIPPGPGDFAEDKRVWDIAWAAAAAFFSYAMEGRVEPR